MIEENDYYDDATGVIDVPFLTKYRPEGTPGYYAIPGEGLIQASESYEMDPALILGDAPEPELKKGGFPWWALALAGIGGYLIFQG